MVRHARSREGLEWEHEHRVTPDFLLVLLGTRQSVNAQIYVGRLCYTHSLDHSETRQHYQDQGSLLTVKSNRNRGAFHLRSASRHTRRHHPPHLTAWHGSHTSTLYLNANRQTTPRASSSCAPQLLVHSIRTFTRRSNRKKARDLRCRLRRWRSSRPLSRLCSPLTSLDERPQGRIDRRTRPHNLANARKRNILKSMLFTHARVGTLFERDWCLEQRQ